MVNVLIKHGEEIKFGWEGFPIYHKQTLEDSLFFFKPDSENVIANNANNINEVSSFNNNNSSNSNMKRNDSLFSDYDESIENQSELFEKNDNDVSNNDDVLEIIKKVKVNDSLTWNSPMKVPCYSSNLRNHQ
nr:8051_t:CDS:2 [Entrophospora candida]